MTRPRVLLLLALFILAALYASWFGARSQWVALGVFAIPPLSLALALLRGGGARTGFWAGVLALRRLGLEPRIVCSGHPGGAQEIECLRTFSCAPTISQIAVQVLVPEPGYLSRGRPPSDRGPD